MRTAIRLLLAATTTVGVPVVSPLRAGGYAGAVTRYEPGTGYATDWQTGAGFTNTSAVLGAPSRVTVDPDPQFGGTFAVDPFSPPYLAGQLLSIGAGGSLSVTLSQPATDDPGHLFGIDFIVFGSAGFIITNGDFTGGGITDGSLLGAQTGSTRVEASADGVTFYELAPSLAPVFDTYLPTDGAGDFFIAANPQLREADFHGLGLPGIRNLYAGSAGGTGYDLAWARDAEGRPIQLSSARQLRLSVLSGHAEVDAIVVVPEPGIGSLCASGLLGLLLARREPEGR